MVAGAGTYLGPEIDLSSKRVNLGFGAMATVSGRGQGVLFTWGVGGWF